MGFEADITQALGSTGNQTQIVLAEKAEFKDAHPTDIRPIVISTAGDVDPASGDFPRFQPVLSGVDLAFLGTLIESGIFTGTRARAAAYPGQLRGQGGFVAGSSPLVAPLLIRNLMQDRDPSYNILGGTGVTIPNPVDVVDSQELAGQTVVASPAGLTGRELIDTKTVADELDTTTNVVQLTITPEAASADVDITVVNDQALDVTVALTIADDLEIDLGTAGSTGYDVPLQLTVAPDAASTLSDTTEMAYVRIKGTDPDGNTQTVVLEFSDANKTDEQTTTEYFLKVTEVTAVDDPDANPLTTNWASGSMVTITATIAADVTLGEGIEFASVRIEGPDNNDKEISETVYFDEDGKSTAQTTDQFFKEITKVTTSGWAGGAFDISAQDKAVRITIEAQDEEPVCYLFGELTRGLIPALLDDMLVSQLTIAVTPEELIRFAIQTIYREEIAQQNIGGDDDSDARKSDASSLEFPTEDFFVGFQAVLFIDGIQAPAKSVTLTVNQNWQNVGGLSGEQTDESQPIAITRETGLTGDFVYATQNNLNENFLSNRPFQNLEVRITNKFDGGFPAQIRILMAKGQLAANPIPTYADTGEITQAFEIRCLPSQIGESDDIKWVIDTPQYERLRDYS